VLCSGRRYRTPGRPQTATNLDLRYDD